jgi:hypothetical protein
MGALLTLLSPLASGAGRLAKALPIWAWALIIALAWGAWQRHQVKSVERTHANAIATAAAEREQQLTKDAAETTRRLQVQKEAANVAQQKAQVLASDVARLRTAEQRLRDQLATVAANAGPSHPAPADGSPPASQTTGVLADLLSKCVGRVRRLAEYADATATAGDTCERSYEALTPNLDHQEPAKPPTCQFWR